MARIAFDIDDRVKQEIKVRLAREKRTLSYVMRIFCERYKNFGLYPGWMEILLVQCGEALENCISAMTDLGAPANLCELVEADNLLAHLNKLFELKDGTSFSMLLTKMGDDAEP